MLQSKNVGKTFHRGKTGIQAVKNVSLALPQGKITAIVGRSGSGKSTLLNLLAGLLTPTTGAVFFRDRDLYRQSDRALSELRNRKIGIIPQGQTPLSALSVLQNILLPTELYPDGNDYTERAHALLEEVGIPSLAGAKPATLSGGELRRMAVARAMICRPEVILADEPTGDLDSDSTNEVIRLLRKTADEGTAVLLVTHDMDILGSADAVYQMEDGMLSRRE